MATEQKKKKHKSKDKKRESQSENHRLSDIPTMKLLKETDIAMDFATKAYKKFDKVIKSIILFGSSVKQTAVASSDIDIIIIIDDAAIQWDQELTVWYREKLAKLIQRNPYKRSLHINTVKVTTWWQDLLRGDPVVINILRYGEALIDFGGFFNPLKALLIQGKIKSTPEAIYTCLQRAPQHLARSRTAELGSIEGLYWAMVDAAHAALMAAKQIPPSPEHVPIMLKDIFINKKLLKMKYVVWYRDIYLLHRKIIHGDITDIEGKNIDNWQKRTDEFIRVMAELIKKIIK